MSQMKQAFLVEIGTEELPPKALKGLSQAFADGILSGLREAELEFDGLKVYAAPRRLAVMLESLQCQQADKVVEKKGPAKKAAFDAEGNPTKALLGFMRGSGAELSDLVEVETDKGAWMAFNQEVKGQAAEELLPEIVRQSLAKLPIPKRMRWGSSDVEFVRPVHWVLMLLGNDVVPAEILGHQTSNTTRGHRFHAPQAIEIAKPSDYINTLCTQGYVQADFATRADMIRLQVEAAAKAEGGVAQIDEDLLEEVTALNEWPQAIVGDFDDLFLSVPQEALVSAMKGHQKYFHMLDADGKLMAKFITISNIESSNPASVKSGNERVIRPRLSDAKFFWDQDLKNPLDDFLPRLKTVVFQQQLGTLLDKVDRMENLSVKIGRLLGEDAALCERAAHLSKCDLMSEMVGEFPELQGVMGRYYAEAQNENPAVSEALDAQYQPRFAGDELPASGVAQALAIADKLDTITGIYGIGQVPTGDKDPFALRRAALGMLRIMIEKSLDLDLVELIEAGLQQHDGVKMTDELVMDIYDFIVSRLKAYFADQGISAEQFEAVRFCQPRQPLDFAKRIEAVQRFSSMEEAESLSAANKRISNLLKKVEGDVSADVNVGLFVEAAEENLYQELQALQDKVAGLIENRDYIAAIGEMSSIRNTVDRFFDEVMVMAEDEAVRNNRLALLQQIYQLFLQVADISRL
ncbi:glycine--tRNA ligase subunit beta [Thiomicrorhabdus heinhorstiae]|uniref:Glycine--tRNA ligase beta subunit n=1 Tax=Thiomicrorhabdus heinhorstiae TaxID=2748010 RepID=A0ABS0BZA4_9GAMM|nr:glycine--tRNA ligase subunit beta [Thiomicrorhabdus heinhorstiae]MBF6058319.1 glycine--tRNA ligase subunit beta [Thiomicrorhabdus heinhorstiae]